MTDNPISRLNNNFDNNTKLQRDTLYYVITNNNTKTITSCFSTFFENKQQEKRYREFIISKSKKGQILTLIIILLYYIAHLQNNISNSEIRSRLENILIGVFIFLHIIFSVIFILVSNQTTKDFFSYIFFIMINLITFYGIVVSVDIENYNKEIRTILRITYVHFIATSSMFFVITRPSRCLCYINIILQEASLAYCLIKNDSLKLIQEFIVVALGMIIPELVLMFDRTARQAFIGMEKAQILSNYYEDFIQYLGAQKISIHSDDGKIVHANNKFYSNIKKWIIENKSELIKEISKGRISRYYSLINTDDFNLLNYNINKGSKGDANYMNNSNKNDKNDNNYQDFILNTEMMDLNTDSIRKNKNLMLLQEHIDYLKQLNKESDSYDITINHINKDIHYNDDININIPIKENKTKLETKRCEREVHFKSEKKEKAIKSKTQSKEKTDINNNSNNHAIDDNRNINHCSESIFNESRFFSSLSFFNKIYFSNLIKIDEFDSKSSFNKMSSKGKNFLDILFEFFYYSKNTKDDDLIVNINNNENNDYELYNSNQYSNQVDQLQQLQNEMESFNNNQKIHSDNLIYEKKNNKSFELNIDYNYHNSFTYNEKNDLNKNSYKSINENNNSFDRIEKVYKSDQRKKIILNTNTNIKNNNNNTNNNCNIDSSFRLHGQQQHSFHNLGIFMLNPISNNNNNHNTNTNNGISKYNNTTANIYLEISIRKFNFSNNSANTSIFDIVINDITEHKLSERRSTEAKLKQKVLSKIAHEFKTPIIMSINLLSEINQKINEKDLEVCSLLCCQTIRLSEYLTFLINDVIYYASNDLKMNIEEQDDCDIIEVIEFAYNVCACLIALYKKPITPLIEIDVKELKKYRITSDSLRLKQVLLNFISNAVKFTRSGEIKLKCYIEEKSIKDYNSNINTNSQIDIDSNMRNNNRYHNCCYRNNIINANTSSLIITVNDTGVGMNEEDLRQLNFHETTIKPLQFNLEKDYNRIGSGMGINICKSIIDKLPFHYLIFNSKEQEGTEVSLSISNIRKKNNEIASLNNSYLYNNKNKYLSSIESNNSSIYKRKEDANIRKIRNNSYCYNPLYAYNSLNSFNIKKAIPTTKSFESNNIYSRDDNTINSNNSRRYYNNINSNFEFKRMSAGSLKNKSLSSFIVGNKTSNNNNNDNNYRNDNSKNENKVNSSKLQDSSFLKNKYHINNKSFHHLKQITFSDLKYSNTENDLKIGNKLQETYINSNNNNVSLNTIEISRLLCNYDSKHASHFSNNHNSNKSIFQYNSYKNTSNSVTNCLKTKLKEDSICIFNNLNCNNDNNYNIHSHTNHKSSNDINYYKNINNKNLNFNTKLNNEIIHNTNTCIVNKKRTLVNINNKRDNNNNNHNIDINDNISQLMIPINNKSSSKESNIKKRIKNNQQYFDNRLKIQQSNRNKRNIEYFKNILSVKKKDNDNFNNINSICNSDSNSISKSDSSATHLRNYSSSIVNNNYYKAYNDEIKEKESVFKLSESQTPLTNTNTTKILDKIPMINFFNTKHNFTDNEFCDFNYTLGKDSADSIGIINVTNKNTISGSKKTVDFVDNVNNNNEVSSFNNELAIDFDKSNNLENISKNIDIGNNNNILDTNFNINSNIDSSNTLAIINKALEKKSYKNSKDHIKSHFNHNIYKTNLNDVNYNEEYKDIKYDESSSYYSSEYDNHINSINNVSYNKKILINDQSININSFIPLVKVDKKNEKIQENNNVKCGQEHTNSLITYNNRNTSIKDIRLSYINNTNSKYSSKNLYHFSSNTDNKTTSSKSSQNNLIKSNSNYTNITNNTNISNNNRNANVLNKTTKNITKNRSKFSNKRISKLDNDNNNYTSDIFNTNIKANIINNNSNTGNNYFLTYLNSDKNNTYTNEQNKSNQSPKSYNSHEAINSINKENIDTINAKKPKITKAKRKKLSNNKIIKTTKSSKHSRYLFSRNSKPIVIFNNKKLITQNFVIQNKAFTISKKENYSFSIQGKQFQSQKELLNNTQNKTNNIISSVENQYRYNKERKISDLINYDMFSTKNRVSSNKENNNRHYSSDPFINKNPLDHTINLNNINISNFINLNSLSYRYSKNAASSTSESLKNYNKLNMSSHKELYGLENIKEEVLKHNSDANNNNNIENKGNNGHEITVKEDHAISNSYLNNNLETENINRIIFINNKSKKEHNDNDILNYSLVNKTNNSINNNNINNNSYLISNNNNYTESPKQLMKLEPRFNISNTKIIKSNNNINPTQSLINSINEESNPIKILIVDDNYNIRKSMSNLVKSIIKTSCMVIECNDGISMLNEVMLDQSNGSLIKLIITDENMDFFQGSKAIKIIKTWEFDKKIQKIIIFSVTAFEDSMTKEEINNAGADKIISKPLTKKNLIKSLCEFDLMI